MSSESHAVDVRGDESTVTHSAMGHVMAPLVAIAATWAVRRAMNFGYRNFTGSKPPEPHDPTVSWARVLVWTAVTASTAAVVEVAIYRYLSARSLKD